MAFYAFRVNVFWGRRRVAEGEVDLCRLFIQAAGGGEGGFKGQGGIMGVEVTKGHWVGGTIGLFVT